MNIYITTYDGDAEEYDREVGDPGDVVRTKRYTDGEELDAAARIVNLLSETTHFDVRVEVY